MTTNPPRGRRSGAVTILLLLVALASFSATFEQLFLTSDFLNFLRSVSTTLPAECSDGHYFDVSGWALVSGGAPQPRNCSPSGSAASPTPPATPSGRDDIGIQWPAALAGLSLLVGVALAIQGIVVGRRRSAALAGLSGAALLLLLFEHQRFLSVLVQRFQPSDSGVAPPLENHVAPGLLIALVATGLAALLQITPPAVGAVRRALAPLPD